MNHYQALNVSHRATQQQIKQSYRQLAKELHPDRNPNDKQAELRFLQIAEAYQVLGDEAKRKKYDQQLQVHREKEPAAASQNAGQGTDQFSATDKESIYQSASSFEQFFGFRTDGTKAKKRPTKEPLDATSLFEDYFTGKKRG